MATFFDTKETDVQDYEIVEIGEVGDENNAPNDVKVSQVVGKGSKIKKGNGKKRRDSDMSFKSATNDENLLGARVELKWSSGRWYRGTVCEYNELEKKHQVQYDDGDVRWYHLPEMVYRHVKEEDEWIDVPKHPNETAEFKARLGAPRSSSGGVAV